MNDNNELTQEQANKEIDLKTQNDTSIQKLESIKDNTGFYIIVFAVKIIIYIALIVLAGKEAYDLLQFLF